MMLDWLLGWLTKFVAWLWDLAVAAVKAVVELLRDFVVWVLDQIFGAIATMIEAIPVPGFLESYSLSSLFGPLSGEIGWFINTFGIPEGLALIGAGFAFRMTRKLVTLGQW